MSSFTFKPAADVTGAHGVFVALVAPTNAGKTVSGLRLARGLAGDKKVAVLDTEGGRTLHYRKEFPFDFLKMDPPHRPSRYAEAAKAAEEAGYGALLIDSFSAEWAGMGGVLEWQEAQLQRMAGDDFRKRDRMKMASWIEPKMAHKAMVQSFLQRTMPIIFSIRGEESVKPAEGGGKPDKIFKAITAKPFLFEVTVSFRLAADRKGIIDLSDPSGWKMEGAHRAIFRDGDQLSEAHGAALAAWARGEGAEAQTSAPPPAPGLPMLKPDGGLAEAPDVDRWQRWCIAAVAKLESHEALAAWGRDMEPHLRAIYATEPDAVVTVREAIRDRLNTLADAQQGADA